MRISIVQNQVTNTLYFAIQYLSNAARCYLPKRQNDSHLDLCFSLSEQSISLVLSDYPKKKFSFNYARITLEWTNNNASKIIRLNGTKHREVLSWIRKVAKQSGYKRTYSYVLPDKRKFFITDSSVHNFSALKEIDGRMELRGYAHKAIKMALAQQGVETSIALKPYFLSSSVRIMTPMLKGACFEFGYAIPDQFSAEPYFYIKCYGNNRIIYVNNMNMLKTGCWITTEFHGAILPATNSNTEKVALFLEETLIAYSKKLDSKQ